MSDAQAERDEIRLATSEVSCSFVPRLGGSLTSFRVATSRGWTPIMREALRPMKTSSDASSFLMAPYPNRVANGVFEFEGAEHRLANPEKHSIHGCARNRPWSVIESDARSATLAFRTADFPDIDFPFPFGIEMRYELVERGLRTVTTIVNESSSAMPAGFGYHPYFRTSLFAEGEVPMVTFAAETLYPASGPVPIPTGDPVGIPAEMSYRRAAPLRTGFDHCFGGWDGRATIAWPGSKVTVTITATRELGHLVLYTPEGKDFFAIEPQTQMIDGFNALARGAGYTGVAVLRPGEKLTGTWTIEAREER